MGSQEPPVRGVTPLQPATTNMRHLLVLSLLALASARREGSGWPLSDSEEDDDDLYNPFYEGSADDLILKPDGELGEEESFGIQFGQQMYDDLEDEVIEDYYDEYDDGDLTLKVDTVRDSVLKIVPEIEIKPKPSLIDTEYALETSHILIMIGSAFVSFGVIMLTFFLCKKSVEKKQEKINSIVINREKMEPSPIVKDYQRVPTDTKEYLETREETHIEMYKGDRVSQESHNTSQPL